MKPHVFEIRPFDGVGPIRLGMSRQELRRLLGGEVEAFRKTQDSPTLSDYFNDYMAVAFYTPNDLLDAFEFSQGNVEWQGIQLMGRIGGEVLREMQQYSKQIEIDAGVIFHDLGIALYVPSWGTRPDEDEENIVESVLVFSRTHYTSDY